MHPQSASPFFRIPFELRDEIYSLLFTSTRLTFGFRVANDNQTLIKLQPSPHALALVRACRRTNAEISKSWLGHVLFSFEDPRTMLDKLATLPVEELSLVRYVSVRGDCLRLTYPPKRHVHHRLVSVFGLLPGLRLHRLTILGGRGDKSQYRMLDELVKYGSGWRELQFISHSSGLLGYAYYCFDAVFRHRYQRKPQPQHWQSMLEERDGAQSCPSVLIYRASRPGCRGDVLRPQTRTLVHQSDAEASFAEYEYGTEEDLSLVGESERAKELMLVVQRGQQVAYEEQEATPLLPTPDMRGDFPGKSWTEIRAACVEGWETEDEVASHFMIDSYHDVNEYTWTARSTYNPATRDSLLNTPMEFPEPSGSICFY
ncbi:hypothetical protein QBC40DRAFT_237681 [Triangularia verruculosa]|uniref:F-box domain-containing protein n=1 Tax=Triangularia verruculosa TaxID=2587418 RepID=A0AAN7AQL8_9PEZI|nr:hypothetical protein QBC40DRAFT_237681 [Triangularia verruculosa]